MKVWDLHCDTLSELRKAEHAGRPKSFAQNDLHIDLEKLQKGDYLLQCFAAFVNLGDKTPGADPLVTALEEIDQFKRIMAAYPEKIAPVYTAADIRRNAAAGKISGMLTIEEGACCKGSVGVLRRMYELGVRMMTLTWNHDNELAAPQANPGGPLVANTETGLLCYVGMTDCHGGVPRNFAIDPTGRYVIVANQDTDNLVVFSIGIDGVLTYVTETFAPTPVCVRPYLLG